MEVSNEELVQAIQLRQMLEQQMVPTRGVTFHNPMKAIGGHTRAVHLLPLLSYIYVPAFNDRSLNFCWLWFGVSLRFRW